MNLEKLLKPKKIAIVGASDKDGFGGDTCRNIIGHMAEGTYYLINPKRDTVMAKKCYPSISALPENIDLLVICTPMSTVENLVKEASAKGAEGIVLYASGYSEVGTEDGRNAEKSLIELCKSLDMALVGPNCAGYINYIDNVHAFAFISAERDRKGNVGVISQSGQLVLSMMDSPKMKFSYAISAGNAGVCTMEDYLDFLIADEDTKVVAMYLEGVKKSQRFIDALRRAALKNKPIVVLKAGRSSKGQKIAASHTGSLSGADKVYDALFEKFGVIRVDDLEELMAVATALSVIKNMPQKPNVASMNLSGGETGICADLGEKYGIFYPDFTPETIASLKEQLPSYATPNNPLDMTATLSYDVEKYAQALQTVMDDPNVGLIAVGYTLLEEIADPAIHYMAKAMELVCQKPDAKPVVMVPFGENTRNFEYCEKLEKVGIPVMSTSLYAFKAIKHIMDFVAYAADEHDLNVVVSTVKAGERTALSESDSKAELAPYGMPFPKMKIASTPEEAGIMAEEVGYPLVAKIDSPDILHKSDIGCVKLPINNKEEAIRAFEEVLHNAKSHCPMARIQGVQFNQMAKQGTEMIIGVNNDPQFGPCVLCGLGGVFVEVFKDTALCLAPVSKCEALAMINSLKGVKLLNGYRGNPPLDVNAFADAIVSVSKYATEHNDSLKELDINPVFLYESGICAVDALVIK